MTTYTAIPNGDVDQDSPVTQTLVTLLRDNPIAITEGASGAPRVKPVALESGLLGRTTADNDAIDVTGVKNIRINWAIAYNATTGSSTLSVAFSDDGGSTWGSAQNLFNVSPVSSLGASGSAELEIDLETGAWQAAGILATRDGTPLDSSNISSSGTLTPLSNVNRVRFSRTGASTAFFAGLVIAVGG